jgi:hypothetical protein
LNDLDDLPLALPERSGFRPLNTGRRLPWSSGGEERMNKRFRFAVLVAIVGLFITGRSAHSKTVDPTDPTATITAGILSKLVAGTPAAAIEKLHEPPGWDKARSDSDRREVSDALVAILGDFGTISSPQIVDSVAFYELQLAGGDLPYWQKLPNMGVDSKVTYLVDFSKVGPGVVAISLTHATGAWELRSISLGLEKNGAAARSKMEPLGRAFFARMDPGMPRDKLDELVDQTFGAESPK